jgi:hypothetical protein
MVIEHIKEREFDDMTGGKIGRLLQPLEEQEG